MTRGVHARFVLTSALIFELLTAGGEPVAPGNIAIASRRAHNMRVRPTADSIEPEPCPFALRAPRAVGAGHQG